MKCEGVAVLKGDLGGGRAKPLSNIKNSNKNVTTGHQKDKRTREGQ